jgi:hypothetical protein
LFDFVRPQVRYRRSVEQWYRYNMLVFAREDAAARFAPRVAATRIDPRAAVPDLAPLGWRMRRRALRALPPSLVTRMAAVKHRLVLRRDAARVGLP